MKRLLGLAVLCIGGTAAFAANFPETEPNDTKAAANAVTLVANDTVSGATTGNSTSVAGPGSADYFRLKTGALALGNIYRHRMVLTTGDVTNIAPTIRGLNQTSGGAGNPGVIGATDAALQSSTSSTTPPRFSQWYGFGRQEEIYFRLTGTAAAANAGAYTCTLSTTTVSATNVGNRLEGPITIAQGTGNVTPIDFWVYDSNLNPLSDYGNAGNNSLTRNYTAGTYYVAFSNANTANNLPSPAGDSNQTGAVMDFANGVLNSSTTTVANMAIKVTDVSGALEAAGAKSGPYDVVWYSFSVVAANVACCFSNGSCTVQGVTACLNAGGSPQGVGSVCSPNPCPQPGACCLSSGGCAVLLQSTCTAQAGQFIDGSCPGTCQAAEACCLANNSCSNLAPFACAAQGGTSRGPGSVCTPSLCVPPGGTCDAPEVIGSLPFDTTFNNATNTSQAPPGSCNTTTTTMDNSYWLRWDADQDCEVLVSTTSTYDNICAIYSGDCQNLTEVGCIDPGVGGTEQGTFIATGGTTYWLQVGDWGVADGGGATTFHMECVAQGACCLPNGSCAEQSSLACTTALGVFQGDGSTCAGTNCPPAEGCCFNNQTCQFLTPARCTTLAGTSLGTGTDCNAATCIRGACCQGVVCTVSYQQLCAGGFYQGDGTNCDSVAGIPTTYTSNPNLSIPDSGGPVVTDTIIVPDNYTVGDVNVHMIIPNHTFLGDLDIFLAHGATTVQIWSRDCGGNDGMNLTVDDEGAALLCGTPTTGTFSTSSITAGVFLNAFDGSNVNGDWTISLDDQAGADTGTLTTWELIIDQQGVGVCFPAEPLACCFPNGNCQFILPADCQGAGGSVLGLGTNCSPNVCPQPQRCCLPNGTCQVILAATCGTQGGTAGGAGTTCSPNPCPPPVACCIGTGGVCQNLTTAACAAANGAAGPAGSSCSDTPSWCSHGACCDGTNCTIQTRGACVAAGDSYVGADTNCGAVAGTPHTYSQSPNLTMADFVGAPSVVTDTITVADTYTVGDVKVGVIIRHTFQGDIIATITAPNNAVVTLINRPNQPETTFGWGNDNYGNEANTIYFVLSDDAAARYDVPGTPTDNPVGDWLPDTGPLSDLDGQPVTGAWTISVSDNAGGDTGVFVSWELIIDEPGPGPCSGPSCVLGDVNCDGVVNNFDIDSFVLIIVNNGDTNPPAGWQNGVACWENRSCTADIDHSTAVNNFDIDPFVACIVAQQSPCP